MKRPFDPVWDTPMPADEFARRQAEGAARLSGPEGDEMRALMAWFMRRYPTVIDRLRYVRKQMTSIQAVQAHQGSASEQSSSVGREALPLGDTNGGGVDGGFGAIDVNR
jgi:hypothetical protein